MNILWLIVDDLRPQLGSYGQGATLTPALDALAAESVVFEMAYAQFAVCAPSRNSFMSGRRPDRTQAFNFLDDFREVGANWTTLPEHFKNNGYLTLGGGKTFHPDLPPDYDEPYSWSQDVPYFPFVEDSCNNSVPPYNFSDDDICTVADGSSLFDSKMAVEAMKWIDEAGVTPFFFAVGIRRPHLPWIVPLEFYDMYANATIPALSQPTLPEGIHNIAWSSEAFSRATLGGRAYANKGPFEPSFDPNVTAELTRGYMVAVSWADAQMGRIINHLDERDEEKNTIVVVHGDHGYQLGEKACWTKHTNLELGTRVPLIIRVPAAARQPRRVRVPVELVDLYKTLSDLARLPEPEPGVQGKSLAKFFFENNKSTTTTEETQQWAAYAQYDRCPTQSEIDNDDDDNNNVTKFHGSCKRVEKEDIYYMGYTIRTLAYRYVCWMRFDGATLAARWTDCDHHRQHNNNDGSFFCARELYYHGEEEDLGDFNGFETTNLAYNATYRPVRDALHARLRAHFHQPHKIR
ncbi:hypothetical protein CTAYLR_002048 [Chrysophaeum taylorii]|uniref:Sulfatase N-terminal domain-containing protein n=1 Tax=Chrysophaeum taylorii TaxID=2483200 RepID=A0AAD7UP29_9STRA|nr:hypothetical protein CTAYLR_002048 [Chrysophaeum taylorii]